MDINKTNGSKPFLKWVGGKSQLLTSIDSYLPEEFVSNPNKFKYFEPFVGGGAVFFHLINKYGIKNAYLSDINPELILTYKVIKRAPKKLINALNELSDTYYSIKDFKDQVADFYYNIREDFNKSRIGFDYNKYSSDHVTRASQMIFLNKTGFNGIFRVNLKGEFNVPCAYSKNPLICDESNILKVNKALKRAKIFHASYNDCKNLIDENSLVYLDPPYRPISSTSNFSSYSKEGFNDDDQMELAKFYIDIHYKGAKTILSNSDPTNFDKNDTFFDDLYCLKDFTIRRVSAKRSVNSKGNKRGLINEILITNY